MFAPKSFLLIRYFLIMPSFPKMLEKFPTSGEHCLSL
jgi:hypothetical protein